MRVPSKKLLVTTVFGIGLITVLLTSIFYVNSKDERTSEALTKISELANSEKVDLNLEKVRDTRLSSRDRYAAFKNIIFDYNAGYFSTHNPALRKFVMENLNEYAKRNFPKEYSAKDFLVACSDLQCGQNINSELKIIIEDIDKSKYIPDYAKRVVLKNLQTVGYSPESDKDQNIFGIELAIDQLDSLAIKQASDAATTLKTYLKNKYNYNYVRFTYEPPK